LITGDTIAAIRTIIDSRGDIDLVPFLGKNLTGRTKWAWANFFHTFALIWAPLDHPPPFSPVTSAVVRRAAMGTEQPLAEGEWELRLIPKLFKSGRFAYSNDIYIDHYKPLNILSCLLVNFHNARAGAAIQRRLGVPARAIIREGRYNRRLRPRELVRAIAHRSDELPAPMLNPLRMVGWSFYFGTLAGVWFGPGRAAHKLD
jgi:hypothetical protein